MNDKIWAARASAPWDYLRHGFIDSTGKMVTERWACFATVAENVFKGCEVFFDRSTPCCLRKKHKGENYTANHMRDEHSPSDIAYVNWLVKESPWSQVFLNPPEDVLENGAMYRTDLNNQYILEAAYLLRDVAEQHIITEQWHELVKLGYDPTVVKLFLEFNASHRGAHTSLTLYNLGADSYKRIFNRDFSTHPKNEEMNRGKAQIYGIQKIWGPTEPKLRYLEKKTNGEFGSYCAYYDGDPNFLEEFCNLNGWKYR